MRTEHGHYVIINIYIVEKKTLKKIVSIHRYLPFVQQLSKHFMNGAMKRRFQTAFKPRRKVKDIKTKSTTAWGQVKGGIYKIPCKCNKAIYVSGKTRKNEHKSKVRLTNEDLRNSRFFKAPYTKGVPLHSL